MDCPRKDVDSFTRLAAGQLDAAEAAALEAHLRDCAECRAAAEAQRALWGALDEWRAAPVSEDFDARLYARIAAEEAEPWWRRILEALRPFSWKPAISVAAACAAILAIFLLQGPLMERAVPQKAVDIDQVESALDDVDMLNQLGTAVPPSAHVHAQPGT